MSPAFGEVDILLKILNRIADVDIRQVLDVYAETIQAVGKKDYPFESENLQILYAEQDFYHYLTLYFKQEKPALAVCELAGRYVSALRLEQYCDGILISALETAPAVRGKAFAKLLVGGVIDWYKNNDPQNLYAHVDRSNLSSIAVHRSCGFVATETQAVYLDGSLHPESVTYCYHIKKGTPR